MRSLWRLGIVVLVAVVGFVAAVVAFDEAPEQGCVVAGARDPFYSAAVQGPIRSDAATYELLVTYASIPVPGARVCVTVIKVGLPALRFSEEAVDLGGGRYRVPAPFDVEGAWEATVNVDRAEQGGVASIPLTLTVEPGADTASRVAP